jgi:para-aminobenzoate synthetase/4-amino-4-deoxychorismate lyase
MEIIVGLEESPRGVYCGAIGYVSPGREAVFSVAIRTAVVETATGNAEIGVGSGITWGSEGGSELSECLAKGAFLARCADGFNLIESLRFDSQGYLLLDRHLQRMRRSADHFGFSFDEVSLRTALQELARGLTGGYKIRILLSPDGSVRLETAPVEESVSPGKPAVARVSNCRVDSADPFLYHKTSRRELYDRALREHPDSYDVIFLNQYDEVTEGCFNTVVISLNGELLTPRLECGLLPGVLREELLEVGALREAFLTLDDLLAADAVWLVNSVRGWRECKVQM